MSNHKITRRGLAAFLIVAIFAASGWTTTGAEEMTLNSAINKSGRQRMLSQRMTKAYCQIGLNIRRDEAQAQIEAGVRLFESQLAELKAFTRSPQIGESLSAVEALWAPYKAIVTRPYNREGATRLLVINEDLLQAAHKVVLQLQDLSGKPVGRLVNISGRQRMLSQRLAKFYMLRELGFRQSLVLDGVDQTRNEFVGAHAELRAAPQNTPEIKKLLDNVSMQWELLDYSIKNDKAQLGEFVALTTEKIVRSMDEATGIYEMLQ